MAYYCYVLKSLKTGQLYKGHTADLNQRLEQHNTGKTRTTRQGIPYVLVYCEKFKTRQEAVVREQHFKSFAGGKELKRLLG